MKKRILFVTYRLNGGGAERALTNITKGIPEEIEIDIVVDYQSDMDYDYRGNVYPLGAKDTGNTGLLKQLYYFIKRICKLRKLKSTGEYAACISFMDIPNLTNILSGNKKCKTIVSERTYLSKVNKRLYRYAVKPMVKFFYNSADSIVSLSNGVRDDLIEKFCTSEKKSFTIYNGYDIASIEKKAKEEAPILIEEDSFIFVTMGRFEKVKGHMQLLRAFRYVNQVIPETRLILGGKGSLKEEYEQYVSKYGLEKKVLIPGFIENPYALSSKCDVCVFPSLYEGFGNVLIENMIQGLPIIATDFRSGAREILAPDTDYRFQQTEEIEYAKYGVIVPVCSEIVDSDLTKEEKLLAEAMITMAKDSSLRNHYSRMSLERAKDFTIEETVKSWLRLAGINGDLNETEKVH